MRHFRAIFCGACTGQKLQLIFLGSFVEVQSCGRDKHLHRIIEVAIAVHEYGRDCTADSSSSALGSLGDDLSRPTSRPDDRYRQSDLFSKSAHALQNCCNPFSIPTTTASACSWFSVR